MEMIYMPTQSFEFGRPIHISYLPIKDSYFQSKYECICNCESYSEISENKMISLVFDKKSISIKSNKIEEDTLYKSIRAIYEFDDVLIILFSSNKYLSIPIGNTSKYNETLYDIRVALKHKRPLKYHKKKELEFPDYEDEEENRYKAKSDPIQQIYFIPSKEDIRNAILANLVTYKLTFSSLLITIAIILFAFFFQTFVFLLALMYPGIIFAIYIREAISNYKAYCKTMTPGVTFILYKEKMVERLHHADIELNYDEFGKEKKAFHTYLFTNGKFGFYISIPKQVIVDNPAFYEAMKNEIKKHK